MTPEMIARIDTWIADQSGYTSRQDAVRYCVDLVLGQGDGEQPSDSAIKVVANSRV